MSKNRPNIVELASEAITGAGSVVKKALTKIAPQSKLKSKGVVFKGRKFTSKGTQKRSAITNSFMLSRMKDRSYAKTKRGLKPVQKTKTGLKKK